MKTKEEINARRRARRAANPEKDRSYNAAYRAANREKLRARQAAYDASRAEEKKAYRASHVEEKKAYDVRYRASGKPLASRRTRLYGLSPEAFQLMILLQKNACGICKEPFLEKLPCVDHCHATGKVRGILCNLCNQAIGMFKDSPAILREAADYLER